LSTPFLPSLRPIHYASIGALFLFVALSLAGAGGAMVRDTDPLWHIAAGDWIWQHHAIPQHDPWSFTAGEYRWLDISWAWDAWFSFLYAQGGWQEAASVNALIIGLTVALIYAACLARSGGMGASLIATLGAVTLLSLHLRPLQITDLMTALWLLILGGVSRGQCRAAWLTALPVSMMIWVNMHGGFVVGPILLAAFFLQALWDRRYRLAMHLCLCGLATLAALLCNPYGWQIFEATWRPLTTVANRFINEWQPLTLSPHVLLLHLYAVLFLILTPRRLLPVAAAERWLAYFWLLMGVISIRHMYIFAIVSAPVFACFLQARLGRFAWPAHAVAIRKTLLRYYDRPLIAIMTGLLSVALCVWLPSASPRLYGQQPVEIPELHAETAFIRAHYPQSCLLTHFNLGGIILYETRGAIPVFIDPRTETAYPPAVLKDYWRFLKAQPGWEDIFARYRLDGVLLPNDDEDVLLDRFRGHAGWTEAFRGPHATLFLRSAP